MFQIGTILAEAPPKKLALRVNTNFVFSIKKLSNFVFAGKIFRNRSQV